jgi:ribosomal protein S18 acetylase RimI-like enzyme
MEADLREQVVLKATAEGRIVGSVRGRVADGTCYVGRLIVHPDVQNRGLGTQLLRALHEACPDVEGFELFTGHLSAAALHIYRKLGYRVFRRAYEHERLTLVYLVRHAPRAQRSGGGR